MKIHLKHVGEIDVEFWMVYGVPMQKDVFENDYVNILQSELKLKKALADGEQSAKQGGRLSTSDVRKKLARNLNR